MHKILCVVLLCSFILGCQHSPQKSYYYLSATQTAETNTHSDTNSTIAQVIGIGPIDLADYLNRLQIIDNQTDNILKMADNAYWAEPLDKAIPRVLALNLTQLNHSRSFVNFPWRTDSKPRYSLRLHIYELSRKDEKASLNANWELVDSNTNNILVRRNFLQTISVRTSTQALALAYSQLLAELTLEINDALTKAQ